MVSRIDSSTTIATSSFLRIPTLQRRFERQVPRRTGLELHRDLAASGNAIPTVWITAYPDDRSRARTRNDFMATAGSWSLDVEGRMSRRSLSHRRKVLALRGSIG